MRVIMAYEFIRFSFVGLTCFIINIVLLFVFIEFYEMHYAAATVVCFFFLNLLGYVLNKFFTFRHKGKFFTSFVKYFSVMVFSLGLNLFLMWILVGVAGLHYMAASVMISILMLLLNFFSHRIWSFEKFRKASS